MKKLFNRFLVIGGFALVLVFNLVPAISQAQGPGAGSLLRCFGPNTGNAAAGEMVRGDLYDSNNQKRGNIVTKVIGMDTDNLPIVEHTITVNNKNGRYLGTITQVEDITNRAIMGRAGAEAGTAFPEVAAELAANPNLKIYTFNTNSPVSQGEAIDSLSCANTIEVRCVYLVEETANGPVFKKCLSCHFFIVGCYL